MIDNLNDTYAMKKLFLLVIVLFLSFQQVTLAAIGEAANTPDSVFLFSYATSRDDGRSGLRFAWSMDQKHWFAVGQGTVPPLRYRPLGIARRKCSIRS